MRHCAAFASRLSEDANGRSLPNSINNRRDYEKSSLASGPRICFHTFGRAYAITNDEKLSGQFFQQIKSWRAQNPVGGGVNWNCAMEVALRAMNLLAAFTLFLRSPQMDEAALKDLLTLFDQHGAHIQRN